MDIITTLAVGVFLLCLSAIIWHGSQTIETDAPACPGPQEIESSHVVEMDDGSRVRQTVWVFYYRDGHDVLTKREAL